MTHNLCDINYARSNFITFSKLEKESRKTKKHIRHIIKLGLAFTFIIFFPISGCLQETILKSYEEKTGESINAYLCQAKDIKMHVERRDFSFSHEVFEVFLRAYSERFHFRWFEIKGLCRFLYLNNTFSQPSKIKLR